MADRMKEETIALVAVDLTTRHIGEVARLKKLGQDTPRKTNGDLAEEALEVVNKACAEGSLGFLYRSFTVDPEDMRHES